MCSTSMPGFSSWSRPQKLTFVGLLVAGTTGLLLLGNGYYWPGMAGLMVAVAIVLIGLQFPQH